jgi:hypothetical protein
MKKLPIGIQSFEDLRENDYLYVDKTEDIYRLVTSGKVYFLSRPRRFGKSLLISTMDALFKGKKELFEGLWIYNNWDWSRQHPVIRIDWTSIEHSTPEQIESDMSDFLKQVAGNYGLSLTRKFVSSLFAELIELLHLKTGQKVVVLVDEYDIPVLDAIGSSHEAIEDIKKSLQKFYKILKASDEHLKFVFLTGISKFSGISIFSALNNLNDLTMDEQYASICGCTQIELESNFSEHINRISEHLGMTREVLLANIRKWYDGYTWDGKTSIYNPFSTLLFFFRREFANYWFSTGTPTFLINILKTRNAIDTVLEPITISPRVFDSFDPEKIEEKPLLFQTGYLTIKKKEIISGQPLYTLDVPNSEVRESLLEDLLHVYTDYPTGEAVVLRNDMQQHIRDCDAKSLEKDLRQMLAYIPYNLHIGQETYYHSILLIWIKLLGFDIQGELMTNIGRIDAVWHQPGLTVVAELKYHAKKSTNTLLKAAMKQIRDRKYYEKYFDGDTRTGHTLSLLGVAFTGKDVACRMECVSNI